MKQIDNWIYEACNKNNCPEFYNKIIWNWNNRLKTTGGVARIRYNDDKTNYTWKIELSSAVWSRANEKQHEQTVKHETCHLLAFYIYRKNCGHGKLWKQCMKKADASPSRCHTVDLTGLMRTTYETVCSCGQFYWIGSIRMKRLKNGKRYLCRNCKTAVKLTGRTK